MHSLRWSLMFAALGIAVAGCSSSQTSGTSNSGGSNNVQNAKSPDEQFADIKLEFDSLTIPERAGEKGQKLMADLKAISSKLSPNAQEEATKLASAHNLAKLAEAVNNYDPKNGGPNLPKFDPENPGVGFDPKNFDPSKFPDRKFPEFPKLPDGVKFPDLPKLPDGKFPELPKLPDGLKFPTDPGKLPLDPSKLLPTDPTKIPDLKIPPTPDLKLPSSPDLKFPDLPKFPELKGPTPPPVPQLPKIPE